MNAQKRFDEETIERAKEQYKQEYSKYQDSELQSELAKLAGPEFNSEASSKRTLILGVFGAAAHLAARDREARRRAITEVIAERQKPFQHQAGNQTMAKYCKNCGRQLEGQDRFCDRCGKESGTTPVVELQTMTPPRTRGLDFAAWFFAFMGFVTLFGGFMAYQGVRGTPAEDIAWQVSSNYFVIGFLFLVIGLGLYAMKPRSRPATKCKFCGALIEPNTTFCPHCDRVLV
jgi:uncharacterized OB-fold protein